MLLLRVFSFFIDFLFLLLFMRGCCVVAVYRMLVLFVEVGRWRCSLLIDGRCSFLCVVCLLLLRACCCLSCIVTCSSLLLVVFVFFVDTCCRVWLFVVALRAGDCVLFVVRLSLFVVCCCLVFAVCRL